MRQMRARRAAEFVAVPPPSCLTCDSDDEWFLVQVRLLSLSELLGGDGSADEQRSRRDGSSRLL
jgi:hypothetical protein